MVWYYANQQGKPNVCNILKNMCALWYKIRVEYIIWKFVSNFFFLLNTFIKKGCISSDSKVYYNVTKYLYFMRYGTLMNGDRYWTEREKTINVVEIDESRYFVFFAHKKNIRVAS